MQNYMQKKESGEMLPDSHPSLASTPTFSPADSTAHKVSFRRRLLTHICEHACTQTHRLQKVQNNIAIFSIFFS